MHSLERQNLFDLIQAIFRNFYFFKLSFLVGSEVMNSPGNAGDAGDTDPWVGKILWRRKWQPTLLFLSGEFHGQRSLADCSSWGHNELYMTE